jgi:hypothetical protein
MHVLRTRGFLIMTSLALGAGCGDSKMTTPDAALSPGTAQTPPTGAASVDAWLAQGLYKAWNCEAQVHAGRSPTPHGFNRICSNDALSQGVTGTGEWAAGAAAVKELYASAAGGTPIGYAVYLKQAATSAGGANWYWYEKTPDGVAADGTGDAGAAKTVCVGCHQGAGSDAAHTPTPGGRDQVYTPIAPQHPPAGQAAVEAWIAQGFYKKWSCEDAVHAGRSPTPHGFNRICSNNAIAENAAATGPWPAGSAAVKELYASVAGGTPIGYAVYVKQAADSAAGANWYWYERLPAPDGVVADGTGGAGTARTICVGCHQGAGSDAAHTPTANGHDQVYTPVARK